MNFSRGDFSPDVVAYPKAEIAKSAANTKKLVKGIPGAKDTMSVFSSRLATSTATPKASFYNLTTINLASKWRPDTVAQAQIARFNQHGAGIQRHGTHATGVRSEMVSPVVGQSA
jgi:hypothetical protein